MSFKAVLVLVFATAFSVNALECLFCLGSVNSDCAKGNVSASMVEKCPSTTGYATLEVMEVHDEEIEYLCMSAITFEPQRGVTRGCGAIYKGMDFCEFVVQLGVVEAGSCTSCNSDMCNTHAIKG